MRLHPVPLACGVSLALAALAAQAARYEVEDIGRAMPDAQVVPVALNRSGISVGDATQGGSAVQNAVVMGRGKVLVLPRTGDSASASGINDADAIVGTRFAEKPDKRRAFVVYKGETRALGTLGGDASTGRALNDAGQVVGGSTLKNGFGHAFLYEDGRMIDLGTLGGQTSEAVAISASGIVVGRAQLANGDTHAFSYRKGRMSDLGTLRGAHPGSMSMAAAVNDAGTVTGQSASAGDAGVVHAVRWTSDGGLADLGALPGGDNSFGLGINGEGDIVGGSEIRGRVFHAFIVRAKGHDQGDAAPADKGGHGHVQMADLNDELDHASGAGWVLIAATAINASGQIVGYGTRHGKPAAFLLTPK